MKIIEEETTAGQKMSRNLDLETPGTEGWAGEGLVIKGEPGSEQ